MPPYEEAGKWANDDRITKAKAAAYRKKNLERPDGDLLICANEIKVVLAEKLIRLGVDEDKIKYFSIGIHRKDGGLQLEIQDPNSSEASLLEESFGCNEMHKGQVDTMRFGERHGNKITYNASSLADICNTVNNWVGNPKAIDLDALLGNQNSGYCKG